MVILSIIAMAVIVGIFIYIDESRKAERTKHKDDAPASQQSAPMYTPPSNPPRYIPPINLPSDEEDGMMQSSIYDKISISVPNDYDFMEIKIAGTNYRRGLKDFVGEFDGHLVAEPNNEYDPNAIAIKIGRKKLGYVPADETEFVRKFTNGVLPYNCHGVLSEAWDEDDGHHFYWGMVVIVKKKS